MHRADHTRCGGVLRRPRRPRACSRARLLRSRTELPPDRVGLRCARGRASRPRHLRRGSARDIDGRRNHRNAQGPGRHRRQALRRTPRPAALSAPLPIRRRLGGAQNLRHGTGHRRMRTATALAIPRRHCRRRSIRTSRRPFRHRGRSVRGTRVRAPQRALRVEADRRPARGRLRCRHSVRGRRQPPPVAHRARPHRPRDGAGR